MKSIFKELFNGFLGNSSRWYKLLILSFLIINPLVCLLEKHILNTEFLIVGWMVIIEAIVIIMMIRQCFPFPPLSLLVCEAVILHLTKASKIYNEITHNLPVILLVIFSMAAIYFHKNFLSYIFSKIILKVRSKVALAISIFVLSALMSAFLDALTVMVIMVSVATGLYQGYIKYIEEHKNNEDNSKNIDSLKAFIRDLLMTSAIGTAVGGVSTLIGEPQNFIIGKVMAWDFATFAYNMRSITIPCSIVAVIICFILQKFKIFGYGTMLTDDVYSVIQKKEDEIEKTMKPSERIKFFMQGISLVLFIGLIATGFTEIGLIAIIIIGFVTAFTGVVDEKKIGEAFEESVPFAILIIMFFAIVTVINHLGLFSPIITWALKFSDKMQLIAFYCVNSILSMISDNVFVATIFINSLNRAFGANLITFEQLEKLAITINAATNISSIATPNGQASLLLLLTSTIAPLVNLSYGKMLKMALPYAISLSIVALIAVSLL